LEAYFNFFGAANEEEVNKRGFQAHCLKITGKSLIFTTLLRAKRATFANAKKLSDFSNNVPGREDNILTGVPVLLSHA